MIRTDIDKFFGDPGLEAYDREGWQSAQRARAAIEKEKPKTQKKASRKPVPRKN